MSPEKLNLWDRIFNRYRREVVEQGKETWNHYSNPNLYWIKPRKYSRDFVKYKIIDRLTGSVKIKKEYLN